MSRAALFANVLAIVLLVATAAAFVFAETLKLEQGPIAGTQVDRILSPVCGCATSRAAISFRLRRPDRVTLEVVDANGDAVRTLVRSKPLARGRSTFTWDGRNDAGQVLPDGTYKPRVDLADFGRTFDLPNRIELDATAPAITVVRVVPWTISPDRDGRSDRLTIRYRLNEPAVASLYVGGVRRLRNRGTRLAHKFEWSGRVDRRPLFGRHRLVVAATDLAGNVSRVRQPRKLRIRFVALPRHRFVVRPGARLLVAVDTDAPRVEWRLGSRRGMARAEPLVLRAPTRPGRYVLTVRVSSQTARARVRVVA